MRWIIALLTFSSLVEAAPLQHICDKGQFHATKYSVCYDIDTASPSADVLYFFHGYGGDQNSYYASADFKAMRAIWDRQGVAQPRAITLSFSNAWFLTQVPHAPNDALYPLFVRVLMPQFEARLAQLSHRPVAHRILMGESMGGFNVSQLVLKDAELFSKAALLCAAITELAPSSTPAIVANYVARGGPNVHADWVGPYVDWIRWEYPTPQDWANHDPLRGARLARRIGFPLYVSADDKDEYGFNNGDLEFARLLHAKGENVTFDTVHGGHCKIDPAGLAQFLK